MVRISVHVDDFAQEATAESEEQLTKVLVDSSIDLKFELEDGLDQTVAPNKCNAVTSSWRATKMLNRELGMFGTAASAVKDLGVDYGAVKYTTEREARWSRLEDSKLEPSGTIDSKGSGKSLRRGLPKSTSLVSGLVSRMVWRLPGAIPMSSESSEGKVCMLVGSVVKDTVLP
jgi:hypothetical protein